MLSLKYCPSYFLFLQLFYQSEPQRQGVQKGTLLIDNPASWGRMSFSFLMNKSFPSSVPLQTWDVIDLWSLNKSRVWKMSTVLKAATQSMKVSILRHRRTSQTHPAVGFLLVEKSVFADIFHPDVWSLKRRLTQAARIMWTDSGVHWG